MTMLIVAQLSCRQGLQLQHICSSGFSLLFQGHRCGLATQTALFAPAVDSKTNQVSAFSIQQGCKGSWQLGSSHGSSSSSSKVLTSRFSHTEAASDKTLHCNGLQQFSTTALDGPNTTWQQQRQQRLQQQHIWQQTESYNTWWHHSSSNSSSSSTGGCTSSCIHQQQHALWVNSSRHVLSSFAAGNPDLVHLQSSSCTTIGVGRPFHSSSSPASVLIGDSSSSSSSSPSWVDRYLPHHLHPYAHLMRLDKPIGSWLLAWPGLWTIAMAADPGHLPDLWLTTLFAVGAVLMRGAGCTVNDLWDQDIDKKVERTRTRPLAAAAISQKAALTFLAAQLLASFTILLQLNTYTQVLGWCSLTLVGAYPLMKRITWWPQAFLGLCMNYGVLMGYSAAHGSCDWSVVLPMYAAGVSWTLVYDTIYAHQDKKDDARIGVKSTALLFGDRTKRWATGFATLQTLGLIAAGSAAGVGVPYFAAVAAGAGHQAWQIGTVDLNDGPDCMAKFVSNKWYGGILYVGIVLDRLLSVAA